MANVELSIESKTDNFHRLTLQLGQKNLNKASIRSINKAIRASNTAYRRLIRDNYKLMYADTKDLVKPTYARSKAEGTIGGKIQPLSLSRFNPTFVQQGKVFSIKTIKNKTSGKRELTRKSKTARKKDTAGGGVTIEIRKGEKKILPYAFLTESKKNAGVGKQVFARGIYQNNKFHKQKNRYPIQALKSVSPFGMLSREEFSKEIEKGAVETMSKEFNRQIELLLKKANA